MRSVYVAKNSIWGFSSQIVYILLGFIGRTVFIKTLGSEYLGISGLFTNILSLMSLAELGLSSAIGFNLYKPLAKNDNNTISAIVSFYKKAYLNVAFFVLLIGLFLWPFLGHLIKESTFHLNYIKIVYAFYLVKTVVSYLFSYRFTLITADQKGYILVRFDIFFRFIVSIVNVFVLLIFKSFVIYLTVDLLFDFIINMYKSRAVTNLYPFIRIKVNIDRNLEKKILCDVKNIFAGKLSTVILTSTDNIIISAFINITTVGIYSNYSMLISYVMSFVSQITSSTQASIGNMITTESSDYSITILRRLTFIVFLIVSYASVSLFILLNPFISIWLGHTYLLDPYVVSICVLSFYLQSIKAPLWQTLNSAGLFRQDRNIALMGAISNLIISLFLVRFLGIAGVLWGTVFSQVIQMLFKAKLLFCYHFKRNYTWYIMLMLKYFGLLVLQCAFVFVICNFIHFPNIFLSLFFKAMIGFLIPNLINFLLFKNTDEFRYLSLILKNQLSLKPRIG
jgi:O-antigen/teichoic acid export membrane protein